MNRLVRRLLELLTPCSLINALHDVAARARQRRTPGLTAPSLERVHPSVTFETKGKGTITLGNNVQICQGAILSTFGGSITLGDNVYIGPYSVVYGHGGLTIGNNTLIAAHSVLIPANHNFDRVDLPICRQGETRQGIRIGEDCWLGTGVKVLDGVTIGDGSVIAAGAVVNRSIPEYSVAVGVPARVVKNRPHVSPAGNTDPAEYGLQSALSE